MLTCSPGNQEIMECWVLGLWNNEIGILLYQNEAEKMNTFHNILLKNGHKHFGAIPVDKSPKKIGFCLLCHIFLGY